MTIEIGEFVPVYVEVTEKRVIINECDMSKVELTLSEAKRLKDILNGLKL